MLSENLHVGKVSGSEWIHTHFVTDCVRLSHMQGRDIEAALLPVLRQYHIVYGIHLVN
jgi:hypothetical protein